MQNTHTSYKLSLLGTLYFSQGLPFGFFIQALPVLLRHQGLSLPEIGLTSLLALPWALKFLWAPLIDAAPQRKRWIIPLQITAAAILMMIALLDPTTSLNTILLGVLAINLVAATQDIATDGLAISMLNFDERGLGNGIQVAGYRVGMIAGGGAMLVLYDTLGWTFTFGTMSVMLLVASVPLLFHKEPKKQPPAQESEAGGVKFSLLWRFLKRPGMLTWLSVLVAYKLGESLASGMLRPYLVDLGIDTASLGVMLGVVGFSAGLLGAVAGGWLVGRLGRVRALMIFGIAQVLSNALYLLAALGLDRIEMLYLFSSLEHFIGGLATTTLFTMMMDRARQESASTDYTIMASTVVLTVGLGQAASGIVAHYIDYVGVFGASTVISALGMVWIALMRDRLVEPKAQPNDLSSVFE